MSKPNTANPNHDSYFKLFRIGEQRLYFFDSTDRTSVSRAWESVCAEMFRPSSSRWFACVWKMPEHEGPWSTTSIIGINPRPNDDKVGDWS